jgi:hypothetical protein
LIPLCDKKIIYFYISCCQITLKCIFLSADGQQRLIFENKKIFSSDLNPCDPEPGPSVQLSASPRWIEAIAAPRTACRSCCRRRHAGRRPSLSLSALSSSPRRNEEKTVGARPLVVMHVPRKSEFFNVDENKYSQHVDENAS